MRLPDRGRGRSAHSPAPADVSDIMRLPVRRVAHPLRGLHLALDPDELRLQRGSRTLEVVSYERMGPISTVCGRVSFRAYEDNGRSRRIRLPLGLGGAAGLRALLAERRALARGRYRLDATEVAGPAFRRLEVDAASATRWGRATGGLAALALAALLGVVLGAQGWLATLLAVLFSLAGCGALWLGAMLWRDAWQRRGYLELDYSGFTLSHGGRSVSLPWLELQPVGFRHDGLDPKSGWVVLAPRSQAALTAPLRAVTVNRLYSWGLPARSLAILLERYRTAALERQDLLPPGL